MNGIIPGPGCLRFLLAFTVVTHHSFPLRMGAWAVYAFFILSGYWIARMWDERYVQARQPALTFLCSRWCRLAPVFFASLALALVSSYVVPGASPLPQHFSEWALRQLPIIGSKAVGNILPPTWSLDVEMQFYLLFAALMFFCGSQNRKLVNGLMAVLALASFVMIVQELRTGMTGGHQALLSIYFWLFAMGIWIYKTRWMPGKRQALVAAGLFLGITALLVVWPFTRSAIWVRGSTENTLLFNGLEDSRWYVQTWWVMGAIVFAPFIAWNVQQRSGAFDRMLGNWAYPLYLFHWIPRNWYYSQVNWSGPAWHNILLLGVNFAAALAGSWLILKLIDQPADHWRARWMRTRLVKP